MTIDKTRPAKRAKGTLPAFTPVPRHYNRHDGWTPERQLGFIEALADTGSVRAAANTVNMTPEGAYLLRRHPEATEFRKAWEAALALGIQRIEDVAMDRALNGVEVPVYHFGKIIGTRIVYNDRLLMFMLRNRAPKRFAADGAKGMNAVDRMVLARHRKQWRKEWERERAIEEIETEDREDEALWQKLNHMHRNWYRTLSPETRAAYRNFRRLEEAGVDHAQLTDKRLREADAEYEEFFGEGRDRRPQIEKLVDMRGWEGPEEDQA